MSGLRDEEINAVAECLIDRDKRASDPVPVDSTSEDFDTSFNRAFPTPIRGQRETYKRGWDDREPRVKALEQALREAPELHELDALQFKLNTAKVIVPVEDVVLPERPTPYNAANFAAKLPVYYQSDADHHFALLETKLAEAIAQRDAAREINRHHETNDRSFAGFINPEPDEPFTIDGYKDHMEYADDCICVVCQHARIVIKVIERATVAKAALATERARVLQEAAERMKQLAEAAILRARDAETDRFLDLVDIEDGKYDAFQSAEKAVLALIHK